MMTKYEKARIIGTRALQLSKGAPPMVKTDGMIDVIKIAEKELREYKMPFIISRKMPDGSYINVRTCDLVID